MVLGHLVTALLVVAMLSMCVCVCVYYVYITCRVTIVFNDSK